MSNTTFQTRTYPTCCTSAYCGKNSDACTTCENGPVLQEFNDWVESTGAKPVDPIWSPLVYKATKIVGEQ
jgi:hypothetical protein